MGAAARARARGACRPRSAFFGHDATHRQITRRERPSRLLGLLAGNLLNGLSYGWWMDKHNAHHAHPNDLESDPDVHAGALVFDAGQAVGRRGLAGWVTRHQAWLFFPMLTLEALNLHVVERAGAGCVPGLRHRSLEVALLAVHFAAYVVLLRRHADLAAGARLRRACTRRCSASTSGCRSRPATRGCRCSTAEQAPTRCCARC